jgi:hypothetical protein
MDRTAAGAKDAGRSLAKAPGAGQSDRAFALAALSAIVRNAAVRPLPRQTAAHEERREKQRRFAA